MLLSMFYLYKTCIITLVNQSKCIYLLNIIHIDLTFNNLFSKLKKKKVFYFIELFNKNLTYYQVKYPFFSINNKFKCYSLILITNTKEYFKHFHLNYNIHMTHKN